MLSLRERFWFLKSAIQVLFQRTIETYDSDTNTKTTKPLPVRDRLDIAWSCFETFLLGYVYVFDYVEEAPDENEIKVYLELLEDESGES